MNEEKRNKKEEIIEFFLIVGILAISIAIMVIPIYMAFNVITDPAIDYNDIKYTHESYDVVEKVEVIKKEDGKNLIKTKSGDYTFTDNEVKKYIDDGYVLATNVDYTFYIEEGGIGRKSTYKVKELKQTYYPWFDDKANTTVRHSFYKKADSWLGLEFDEIEEDYICKQTDVDKSSLLPIPMFKL